MFLKICSSQKVLASESSHKQKSGITKLHTNVDLSGHLMKNLNVLEEF